MAPESPYPKSTYQKNAKIYKVLANPIRLQILNSIRNEEASVEELTQLTGLRKPNVSQHLAVLRSHDLVVTRRSGQTIFYKLRDPRLVEPCRILRDLYPDQ